MIPFLSILFIETIGVVIFLNSTVRGWGIHNLKCRALFL